MTAQTEASIAPALATWRRVFSQLMSALAAGCAVVVIAALALLLAYVVRRGGGALSWTFLTSLPAPVGEAGGGIGNAIVGTLELVALASCVGLPIGIASGIYLAEADRGALRGAVRFAADVLAAVPSIVVGVFAYTLVVLPTHHFSALAGAIALAVMMIPTAARSTEEVLRLVPRTLREAALALGVPEWKTTMRIILPSARSGLVTGALLAVARVAGETAPLLFTAFGSRLWSVKPTEPVASLPTQIYTYAISPYDDWQSQAWGAALVLTVLVLALNLASRYIVGARSPKAGR